MKKKKDIVNPYLEYEPVEITNRLEPFDAYTDIVSPFYINPEPPCLTNVNTDGVSEVKMNKDGTYTITLTTDSGVTCSYAYPATTGATTISSIPGMWQLPPEEDDYLDDLEESLKDGESELHIANATFNRYRNEIMDLLLKYKYALYKDPMGNLNYKGIRKIS